MPPLHVHEEDESFHVLEGSIIVYAEGRTVQLKVGDEVVVPRGVPHTFRAASESARYVTTTIARSPSAYEGFVRAVAEPIGEPTLAAPEHAVLETLARANGITVLEPPGTLP